MNPGVVVNSDCQFLYSGLEMSSWRGVEVLIYGMRQLMSWAWGSFLDAVPKGGWANEDGHVVVIFPSTFAGCKDVFE